MALPQQVEEAAELAERLHERMSNPDSPVEQVEEEESEAVEDDTTDEVEEVVDTELEEKTDYKQLYKTLKGKYDAEVPRLMRDMNDLKQSVIDRLSNVVEATTSKPKSEVVEDDPYAEVREQYGDDFVRTLQKIVRSENKLSIKQELEPVQQQVASVEELQMQVAQENFQSYLDDSVKGDWKKLWAGQDQGFIDFLQQTDPSGLYTYGDLVQMYNQSWDGDKLAKVFNMYFDTKVTPEVKQPKKANPVQEAMVAPSRNTQHTAPKSEDKLIWTKDTIEEFQRKDRKGDYSSEESMSMWNDLLAAANEGRIR